MSDVRRTYDAIATAYRSRVAGELAHKPLDRRLLDRFAERMQGQGTVWDLGCGPGHVTAYLHERGVDVEGFDLSARMVAEAQQLNPQISFRQADFCALPQELEPPAGIVAFYSLIHLAPEEIVPVLRAWRARLRPGGALLAAAHAGDETIHLDEWWGAKVSIDTHFHQPASLRQWLEIAGFAIEVLTVRDPYPEVEYSSRRVYAVAVVPSE